MRSLATKTSPIVPTTITPFSQQQIGTVFHLCPGNLSSLLARATMTSSSTPIRRHIQCWSTVCWWPTGQLQPTDGPIWNSVKSPSRIWKQSVTVWFFASFLITPFEIDFQHLSSFQDGHRCAIRSACALSTFNDHFWIVPRVLSLKLPGT